MTVYVRFLPSSRTWALDFETKLQYFSSYGMEHLLLGAKVLKFGLKIYSPWVWRPGVYETDKLCRTQLLLFVS